MMPPIASAPASDAAGAGAGLSVASATEGSADERRTAVGLASQRPTFSVLVATYNHSHFIAETLQTVAAQTCTDFELVVVDDGSTDETPRVLDSWVERFRRTHSNAVTLCRIPHGGQSAAFEHGFAHCRGTYICLLDSDDRWLPQKLAATAAAAAAQPHAGMIVHPLYVIDARGRRTGGVLPKRAALSAGDVRHQVATNARQVAPPSSGVTIAARVFRDLVPMPTKRFPSGADAYLTFGASLAAPVCAVREPLGEYRTHGDGAYLRRMMSADGLRRTVELQAAIAGHFGLGTVVGRNSYFARNVFARVKFEGSRRQQMAAYRDLVLATAIDASFGVHDRLLLAAFWSCCLLSPRPAFARLWRTFQLKQTGHDHA